MKDFLKFGAVALVVGFVGGFLALKLVPQTGGDFAGGVVPNQLWTGNAAAGSVSPVGGVPNITTGGYVATNDLIQADQGFSLTITTSTTVTPAQFCAASSIYIPAGAPAGITITLPTATSTYATCGGAPGSFSSQPVTNDSTNTVLTSFGTGMNTHYGYNGSSTQAASTTFMYTGQWISSSSIDINIYQL